MIPRAWTLLALGFILAALAAPPSGAFATRDVAFIGVGDAVAEPLAAEGLCLGTLTVTGQAKVYYSGAAIGMGPSEPGDNQVNGGLGNLGVPGLVDPAVRIMATFMFVPKDPTQPGCGPEPTVAALPLEGSWATGFRDLVTGETELGPYDKETGVAPVRLHVPGFAGLSVDGTVTVADVEA